MRCLWCGEETPDGSTYCEKCGHVLEDGENAADSEDAAFADVDAEPNDAVFADANAEPNDAVESVVDEAESDAVDFDAFDEYPDAPSSIDVETNVDVIRQRYEDDPLVNPPSPPIQPALSRGRVAIVGIIAILFSAAVILLAWAAVLRVLGL